MAIRVTILLSGWQRECSGQSRFRCPSLRRAHVQLFPEVETRVKPESFDPISEQEAGALAICPGGRKAEGKDARKRGFPLSKQEKLKPNQLLVSPPSVFGHMLASHSSSTFRFRPVINPKPMRMGAGLFPGNQPPLYRAQRSG